MKAIIITGYWKSGTTLLQFLLAKSDSLINVFPSEKYNHQDGTQFWKKYIKIDYQNGDYISEEMLNEIDIESMKKELEEMSCGKEYLLLKNPSFILKRNLLNKLFDEYIEIGITRDIYANIHSMLRIIERNKYEENQYFGIHPKGWASMQGKGQIQKLVWQYCYINNCLKKGNVLLIKYEDLCNNTKTIIDKIENEIGFELGIEIPNITSHNFMYKTGGTYETANTMTRTGKLETDRESLKRQKIDLEPLSPLQIKRIDKYYNQYKDIEVII